MKIIIGIQARSNSTRLPGKIYEKIGEKTVLEWVYDACVKGALNNKAISTEVIVIGPKEDERLKEFCDGLGIKCLLPDCDENDLLDRYSKSIGDADAIVRVTSDCPFISDVIVSNVCKLLLEADYVTNTSPRTYPDGWDCQGISMRGLEYYSGFVYSEEHLFFQLENNSEIQKYFMNAFKIKSLISESETILNPYHPANKISIDTKEDLERLRELHEKMAK